MPCPLRVLIVEDSVDDTLLIAAELQRGGWTRSSSGLRQRPPCRRPSTCATGTLSSATIRCRQLTGPAALAIYHQSGLDIPFISVSGTVGEETVAEMMKAGAHDYVMKSNLGRLVPAVKRELRAAQERRDRRQAEAISALPGLHCPIL